VSFTYSGNPSDSDKDEVRFLIGDTDAARPELKDAEVNYLLTIYPKQDGFPNYRAAAAAAQAVAAKHAKAMRKTVGSLSIDHGQKRTQYAELAEELLAKSKESTSRRMGVPQLGGGGDTYLMSDDWS
jgi:hypothetical protein